MDVADAPFATCGVDARREKPVDVVAEGERPRRRRRVHPLEDVDRNPVREESPDHAPVRLEVEDGRVVDKRVDDQQRHVPDVGGLRLVAAKPKRRPFERDVELEFAGFGTGELDGAQRRLAEFPRRSRDPIDELSLELQAERAHRGLVG